MIKQRVIKHGMQDFEGWAKSRELDITKHPDKELGWVYYDIETQMFWECWVASRLVLIGLSTE